MRTGRGFTAASVPRLKRQISAVAAVFFLAAVVACATAPPDRVAYNTIEGAVRGAQAAMSVTGALYQSHRLDNAAYDKARASYEKFQVAARAASQGLRKAVGLEAPTSLDLVNVALQELLQLLGEVTRKTPAELTKGTS